MSGDGAVGLTFVFDNVFVVLHRRVVVAVLLMLPALAHYLGRETMLRVLSRAERLVLGGSLLAVKSCRWKTRLRTMPVIIGWWSIECGRLRSVLGCRSPASHINLR